MESSSEISTDITPEAQELLEGFRSLVLHQSINADILNKIEHFVNVEVERYSTTASGSSTSEADSESESNDGDFVVIPAADDIVANAADIETTPDIIQLSPAASDPSKPHPLSKLIQYRERYVPPSELYTAKNEIDKIFSVHNSKYVWLTQQACVYNFGHRSLHSRHISLFRGISTLMNSLNTTLSLHLNSCLVTRYKEASDSLSRHQDNEELIDQEHPICNVSIGSPRCIEFWSTGKEGTGDLITSIIMNDGGLVTMMQGCQQRTWHKVLQGPSEVRYSLSFRRTTTIELPPLTPTREIKHKHAPSHSISTSLPDQPVTSPTFPDEPSTPPPDIKHKLVSAHSTPISLPDKPATLPRTDVQLHPSNEPSSGPSTIPPADSSCPSTQQQAMSSPAPTAAYTAYDHIQSYPHTLPASHAPLIEDLPLATDSQSPPPPPPSVSSQKPPQHLIIGDSLVKGLNVPNTIHICKGGIHPKEVLQLLPCSTDILPTNCYDSIRTITLIVGTNAININNNSPRIPLLEVINDYNQLVLQLREIFPNARIGLFNIIPRAYSTSETLYRIETFNTVFFQHVIGNIPNVFWIRLYWEFIEESGHLKHDLYGKGGLHLKYKGKRLMSDTIINFQDAYY